MNGEGAMVILGIDPGFAIVGWGVLECVGGKFRVMGYGSIQTKAGLPIEERLKQIYDGMNTIIDKYKPQIMSIEELFWNTNQKTGICVAEARGTILLSAHQKGLKIFEYTPLQVKQAVVGYGRADKKQVITMVTTLSLLSSAVPLHKFNSSLVSIELLLQSGVIRLINVFLTDLSIS